MEEPEAADQEVMEELVPVEEELVVLVDLGVLAKEVMVALEELVGPAKEATEVEQVVLEDLVVPDKEDMEVALEQEQEASEVDKAVTEVPEVPDKVDTVEMNRLGMVFNLIMVAMQVKLEVMVLLSQHMVVAIIKMLLAVDSLVSKVDLVVSEEILVSGVSLLEDLLVLVKGTTRVKMVAMGMILM